MSVAVGAGRVGGPGASRRRFIQAGGVLASGMLGATSARAAVALEAYAGACSVKPGGRLDFFVRDPGGQLTSDTDATITIVRVSSLVDLTLHTDRLKVRNRAVPVNAHLNGCGWPLSYSLAVPITWRSGLYYAFFLGATGSGCCVPFVVRPVAKTPGAAVLVQIPVLTAQALNTYGGEASQNGSLNGSLYPYYSYNDQKASFDRPFAYRWNYGFDEWQPTLVRWLEYKNIVADFCTSIEMHADPAVLNGYNLFVTAGRDMFWTRAMRSRFDAFIAAGGNAAILGGHTCRYPISLLASAAGVPNRTVGAGLGGALEPDPPGVVSSRSHVPWAELNPPEPEETSFGLGLSRDLPTTGRTPSPYQVKASHWMFSGTGLRPGDTIINSSLAGQYVNAAPARFGTLIPNLGAPRNLTMADLRPFPNGENGGPLTMTIVALGAGASDPNSNGGYIGIFSRGGMQGTVFNVGASGWVLGLRNELARKPQTDVERITENVLRRLSGTHTESAEVRRVGLYGGFPERWLDNFELVLTSAPLLPPWGGYDVRYDTVAFRAHALPRANTVPVYRFTYTKPANEPGNLRVRYSLRPALGNGWVPQGVAFHAFATVLPKTLPVYQHHRVGADGGWHFYYSVNLSEPGWVFDDLAWYAPSE